MKKCPEGALERTHNGIIKLNKELCTGCGICQKVCPGQAVFLAPEGKYPLICDLCGESESPRCVAACSYGALRFQSVPFDEKYPVVPPEEIAEKMREKIWRKKNQR